MVAPAPTDRHRSLIHHADFRRLWTGDALGQLGAQLSMLALPVLAVQHLAATAWQMGVLTAAESAAFLVIGLPAGAWVDRMRKRRVLVVADLVRAGILLLVVAAAASGHASMPLLYAASIALSVATVFFDVAHQSYVPGLVGLEHVVEGNATLQATGSVAMVAAPALGGWLLRFVSATTLVGANAVAYLVSAAAVSRIRHHEQVADPAARRPLRTEIAEGLRFVVHQPLLRRIVVCTGASNLFGSLGSAVVVIVALRTLGLDEAAFGMVLSASAVGGLLGALVADRVGRLVGQGRIIPVSAALSAPAAALTPLAVVLPVPPQVTLMLGGFTFGVCVVVYNVTQVSYRQRLCPPALLGRMNASVRFLVWGTMPIGGLLGGWLGSTLGPVPTLWVSAAGIALAALPVVLSPLARLRELPLDDASPSPAPPRP